MCGRQKPDQVENPIPLKSNPSPKSPANPQPFTRKSADLSTTSSSQLSTTSTATASSTSPTAIRSTLPRKPILYSFSEITRATNHFQSQKLGKSSAWKCTLRDKTVVLTRRSTSNPRDFPSLFAELCSVHHAGVVKLIGACADEGYLYLAHEFENGANLSVCLRGSKLAGYTVLSSWIHRIQVATDVAKALEYMHHDIPLHYVHNHIKCSSIIVVEPDFRAKVLHCGSFFLTGEMPVKYNTGSISEIVEEVSGESSGKLRRYGSQKISGVQGYMAPEYIGDRIISQKSDVFAFGVVLLEILTGAEPVKFVHEKGEKQLKKISLVESVGGVVGVHGKLRTWMDVKLKDSYPLDCAEKVAEIAAACVALDPNERPNMRWVSNQLSRVQMKSKKWDQKYQRNKGLTTSLQGR